MRHPRDDSPDTDWLITNRGLAKRAVFETQQDVERFCDAISRVVAAGLLEVDAFACLTTHFHLLVRSPQGDISQAMKLITNEFVRWFNRARKRDGPLFAGRFDGRRIDDPGYWESALRYVDLNPVRAKLCSVPSDHPFGSATSYRHGDGPAWLSRERVGRVLDEFRHGRRDSPAHYDEFVCAIDADLNAYLVERFVSCANRKPPPLADLIRLAPLRQQRWMEWKAALADGMEVGTAFLRPAAALRAARAAERLIRQHGVPPGGRTLGRDLSVGLLRRAAGSTVREIAARMGIATSTVSVAHARYEQWMQSSPNVADCVARALQNAVRRAFAPRPSPLHLEPLVGS